MEMDTLQVYKQEFQLSAQTNNNNNNNNSNNNSNNNVNNTEDKNKDCSILIDHTSSELQRFSQSYQAFNDELETLQQLIPNKNEKCDYTNYIKTLNQLQGELNSVQGIWHKVQLFSQKTFSYLKDITSLFYEQIQIGLPLSHKMIDQYKNDKTKIDEYYTQITKTYEEKIITISNIDCQNAIKEVCNQLKEISMLQISDEEIEKQYEEQRKLLEQKQTICEINNQISLIQLLTTQIQKHIEEINLQIKDKEQKIVSKEAEIKEEIKQINDLHNVSKSKKQEIVEERLQIIKTLMEQKTEVQEQLQQDIYYIKEGIKDSFKKQNSILNKLNVEPVSFYRIFIIDESGSMSGQPFNQAFDAVKGIIQLMQKDQTCEDSFCLIQFDNNARVVQNKKPIKDINVNLIPNKMNGGGTDFSSCFELLKDVLQLCNLQERPQIIFLTDGESGQKQNYLNILQEISSLYNSKGISLFCLAYGTANVDNLKECLKIVNKNEMSLELRNGTKIQTLYQVSVPEEISNVFLKITQMAHFNAYQFTMKTKAIEDMSNSFSNQIQQQQEQQLKQIQLQIDSESQYIELLKSRDDNDQKNIMCQKVEDSYKKLTDAIKDEIKQLKADKENNEKLILQYQGEIKSKEEKIVTENSLINSQQQSDKSAKSLAKIVTINNQIEQKVSDFGFSHESKYNQFNQSMKTPKKKQDELTKFLNQLQQYIEQCKNLTDKIVKQLTRFVDLQKENYKFENSYLIDKFQKVYGISNNSKIRSESELIKDIVFTCDHKLEQYLIDKKIEDFFENSVLTRLSLKLQEIQALKVAQTSDEDNGPFLEDFKEKFFSEVVEENEKLIFIRETIKLLDEDISTLEMQKSNASKEDNKELVKKCEIDLKKMKTVLIKKNKDLAVELKKFRQQHQHERTSIERAVFHLKSRIDDISYKAYQYKIIYPLQKLFQQIDETTQTINKTHQLSLAYN